MSEPCEEFKQDGECFCTTSHLSREDRIDYYAEDSLPSELAEWLVDAEDEIRWWQQEVDRINKINTQLDREKAEMSDLCRGSQSQNRGYHEEIIRLQMVLKAYRSGSHLCPECEYPTEYQMYSGGKGWYCPHCDVNGEYADDEGAWRVQMLRTEEGQKTLRDEMRKYLGRNRE